MTREAAVPDLRRRGRLGSNYLAANSGGSRRVTRCGEMYAGRRAHVWEAGKVLRSDLRPTLLVSGCPEFGFPRGVAFPKRGGLVRGLISRSSRLISEWVGCGLLGDETEVARMGFIVE